MGINLDGLELRTRLYKYKNEIKRNVDRHLSVSTRKKVNLFIIGEQKCGTTSLFSLLSRNVEVLTATMKECHYFGTPKSVNDKGYAHYHRTFRHLLYKKYSYLVDASPDYFADENVHQDIYHYNPAAKIILMLRDPVQRFISSYNFYFSNIISTIENSYQTYFRCTERGLREYEYLKSNEGISIEKFLSDELQLKSPMRALERGNYSKNISKWRETFGENNFTILLFENLTSPLTSENEIKKLEDFLTLKVGKEFPRKNRSMKQAAVSNRVLAALNEYYSSDLNLLAKEHDIFFKSVSAATVV